VQVEQRDPLIVAQHIVHALNIFSVTFIDDPALIGTELIVINDDANGLTLLARRAIRLIDELRPTAYLFRQD